MKRILVIITAALMLLGQTAFAEKVSDDKEYVFCEEEAKSYKVSEMPSFGDQKELTKELDLLVRLNILTGYEDGTLKLDRTITRAEASRMFCYAVYPNSYVTEDIEKAYSKEGIAETKKLCQENSVEFEYNGFDDVALESWYHPYVYAAKNVMNCIDGYEDGTFRPENTVSEIELLTMIERALGYSDMIEAEGGYPQGVIGTANRLKLIDNPLNAPATRGRAALMLYNALHAHIVTIDRYTPNENGYMEAVFSRTITLLEHRDICKIRGTIKKPSVLPDKTVIFIPDNDVLNDRYFHMYKGKEYTFIKAYSDIPEGEYDVYIDYSLPETAAIVGVI